MSGQQPEQDPWSIRLAALPDDIAATVIVLAWGADGAGSTDLPQLRDVQQQNFDLYCRLEKEYVDLARNDLDRAESLTRFLTSHQVAILREFGGFAIKTIIEVSDAAGRDIQPWLDVMRTHLDDPNVQHDEYELFLYDPSLHESFSERNKALIEDLSRAVGLYDDDES